MCSVAGVHDELGLLNNGLEVVGGVVGDDDDGIVQAEVIEWCVGHIERVVAALADLGEVGVVVGDNCAFFPQQLDDSERRRFPEVVYIALICEAKDEDLGAVDRLTVAVEAVGKLIDDEVRHIDVDFAREFDETGSEVKLTGFPREIERVDGNAVATESGAGIEGLEAEGLGFGRIDNLMYVDTHTHTELFELIDKCDVDAAIDVLEELGHLCHSGELTGTTRRKMRSVEG